VDVRIEHCTLCWGYRDRALVVAEALRKRFDAKVDVVDGTLGQFDVHVDGKLISSRGANFLARVKPPRLPKVSDIVAAIERQASIAEGKNLPDGSARQE
jgi:predicted Rdx family selenoprotein